MSDTNTHFYGLDEDELFLFVENATGHVRLELFLELDWMAYLPTSVYIPKYSV